MGERLAKNIRKIYVPSINVGIITGIQYFMLIYCKHNFFIHLHSIIHPGAKIIISFDQLLVPQSEQIRSEQRLVSICTDREICNFKLRKWLRYNRKTVYPMTTEK